MLYQDQRDLFYRAFSPRETREGSVTGVRNTVPIHMRQAQISLPRLRQRLEQLGTIGRDPAGGVTRLPFSPAHVDAVRFVAQAMQEAGLEVGVDEFGILIGQRGDERQPALLVGSHLDTVPGGGMFDGALGVMAGVEAAHALHEAGRGVHHRLVVVAVPDEEGYAFGVGTLSSRALVGQIPRSRFGELRDATGRSLADYLAAREHGLPRSRVPGRVSVYLELHVEQGPVLERMGRTVAAVELITGILRTTAIFDGRASHAGTAPMDARADALVGAAEFVLAVRQLAAASGGRAVGTVGKAQILPGAVNVVPGRVVLSVELRSPDERTLQELRAAVEHRAPAIAQAHGLTVTLRPWDSSRPQPLDPHVREIILHAMEVGGHPRLTLPSWAGHDAAVLAHHVPAGMIFVTSSAGVSHSPREHTPWPAVEAGTRVLLDTLLLLDDDHQEARLPLAYA